MKQNKFRICIGELYLNNVRLDEECGATYFIKAIELHEYYYNVYETNQVLAIKDLLLKLGISEECITVESIEDGE